MTTPMREFIAAGRVDLPAFGEVRKHSAGGLLWAVVDHEGAEIEPIGGFLRDLSLSDMSSLTTRSYGFDLLRWWRLLALVEVDWDHASRADVELLVGWMRLAKNAQRDRGADSSTIAGSVNLRTGKPHLRDGYAPATINHGLTVLSGFYDFHARFGRGPVQNPVPPNARRRLLVAHRSPIEAQTEFRRGALRQKSVQRRPRPIPDPMWDELFAAMGCHRDRALLAFYVPAPPEPANCSVCKVGTSTGPDNGSG